jgi:hypothetical protein
MTFSSWDPPDRAECYCPEHIPKDGKGLIVAEALEDDPVFSGGLILKAGDRIAWRHSEANDLEPNFACAFRYTFDGKVIDNYRLEGLCG